MSTRLGRKKITVYSLQKTRLHHCKNFIHLKSQIVIKKLDLILTVSSVNIKLILKQCLTDDLQQEH